MAYIHVDYVFGEGACLYLGALITDSGIHGYLDLPLAADLETVAIY